MADIALGNEIVDRIVLGTWGLSGVPPGSNVAGYGRVNAETAQGVLDHAWAAGIRYLDTAPVYGVGEGYRRIGRWQRSGRQFKIVVKPGRPSGPSGPRSDVHFSSMQREIEIAERVLGPAAVILIKDPPAVSFESGELADVLDRMESIYPDVICGIASHAISLVNTLPATKRVRVAQIEYNGLNWHSAGPVAGRLRERGWELWGMQPLALGFLTNRYAGEHQFPSDDLRCFIPASIRKLLATCAGVFLRYLENAFPEASHTQRALAFCLCEKNLQRVVAGPKSPEQFGDLLAAFRLSRQPEFQNAMDEFRRSVHATVTETEILL